LSWINSLNKSKSNIVRIHGAHQWDASVLSGLNCFGESIMHLRWVSIAASLWLLDLSSSLGSIKICLYWWAPRFRLDFCASSSCNTVFQSSGSSQIMENCVEIAWYVFNQETIYLFDLVQARLLSCGKLRFST
jgi:hypothetical protein